MLACYFGPGAGAPGRPGWDAEVRQGGGRQPCFKGHAASYPSKGAALPSVFCDLFPLPPLPLLAAGPPGPALPPHGAGPRLQPRRALQPLQPVSEGESRNLIPGISSRLLWCSGTLLEPVNLENRALLGAGGRLRSRRLSQRRACMLHGRRVQSGISACRHGRPSRPARPARLASGRLLLPLTAPPLCPLAPRPACMLVCGSCGI